jgi:predicted phosphodiesterase
MRILLLSDIHGNWPALQAVLHAEADISQIICLGDLVNYGPQPAECVAWAMRFGAEGRVIQGNHDAAFGRDDDPRCTPAYQWLASAMQSATSHLLTREMKQFLAQLPAMDWFPLGDAECVACHAIPSDPLYGYLSEGSALTLWESELNVACHPDVLLVGHTHVPMKTQFQRTLVINPGSVGQPKHGDSRAAYAVWQDGTVTLKRVAYPVEETVRALDALEVQLSVKQRLVEELRTGRTGESEVRSSKAETRKLDRK